MYRNLRDSIIRGELVPGRKVSETEIASELGVSRTPAREALAMLREEGLVEIIPQLGTFVTLLSERAVMDALFARTALECAAIRVAVQRVGPADLVELHANLEEQVIAVAAEDIVAFDELDQGFHRQLCELSGHSVAWSLTRLVRGQLDRARELGLRELRELCELSDAHHGIAEAVAAKDPDEAEERLRRHLDGLGGYLVPTLRRIRPEYFAGE